ncbi:MAG: sugar isomerase [Sulfobacillus acidophilus]|uniref:Sugar isomerase n=1 Tax=Sulfobacillus acidophilus TaxID=53633 RepID=A0A2T2WJM1_9FIRM|nr:MAG: sugar isomerase [Sulfobacillus acidophilus]
MTAGKLVHSVITSQPEAWTKVISSRDYVWQPQDRVLCVGSGSSYYLALVVAALGANIGLDIVALPTQDVILEHGAILRAFSALVIISRSGETSEAVWAAQMAKTTGKSVLAVSCNANASLHSYADASWILPFAHDHTVVMTRSFTSMLLAFEMAFARYVGHTAITQDIQAMVGNSEAFIQQSEQTIQQMVKVPPRRVYVLGSGVRYGTALEGALKCLEMSNEVAAAYRPLEFRHGPWGSVTAEDMVVILGQASHANHERQVLLDLAKRTEKLLVVGQSQWFDQHDVPGMSLVLPDYSDRWLGPMAVVPLQWLGFYWAVNTGRDPDVPKNLDQVVDLQYDRH